MNTDKIYAESLANEYAPKDTSKVVTLKKLDNKAKMPATVSAYSLGIISALVLGAGMCFSMKIIGDGSQTMFIVGVVLGVLGIAGVCVNYPIYKKLLENGKKKYAYEIMELAKEISEAE
ncbi:MAG: dihydropteridine reductase [Erysipelotrichaceae bacterium]|nr:dihydropteridine reductase [Erysipelotrichaceae bacterium]